MVYAIEANSLRRAVDKAPTTLQKVIQGKVFAVPGLSLRPTAKNPQKQLQHLLKTSLQNRSNIVIWDDLLNNSLSLHKNNGNQRSTPETLLEILVLFRKQVTGLVYNQRIRTPFIQKYVVTAKFLTINPRQHFLSNCK